MDRRERFESPFNAMLASLQGLQSDIWTAMPGVIISFNPAEMTCAVQLTINAQVTDAEGQQSWVRVAPLTDCPVIFPSGGGCTLTFPLAAGDECLVILASRCIDAWWQNGGSNNVQAILRMHDLSDGFVLPGPKSLPRVLDNVSTAAAQLRTDDGEAFIELNPTTHKVKIQTVGDAEIAADGDVTVAGNSVEVTSASTVTVTAAGDVTITAGGSASVTAGGSASVTATSSASITAPSISLGDGSASLTKLVNETFVDLFNNHKHTYFHPGPDLTTVSNILMDASDLTSVVKGS